MPSWSTTPFTFTSITAPASAAAIAVTVTVVSVTACPTDAVYAAVPEANPGDSITPLSESALRLASEDPARITTRARQFEQISSVLLGSGTPKTQHTRYGTFHRMMTI